MSSPITVPGMPAYQPANVQGAVPSNPAMDMLSNLQSQRQALQQAQTEAIKQAAVPQQVTGRIDPHLQQIQPFQPAQLNHREVVGKGNARAQGIGNTIIGAMNLVGSFENIAQQKKQKNLSIDIESLYGAMDGADQAKQILKDDPNNADAKKQLDKNQGIVNALLGDDKKRKGIAKALNISFTDPAANNKPEHKAGQEAAKSYAEQLQAKLPTKSVPNEAAQQKAALIQTQIAGVDKAIGDTTKVVVEQSKEENARWIEQNKELHADARTDATNQTRAQIATENTVAAYNRAMDVAKLNKDAAMARTIVAGNMAYKRTMDATNARIVSANGILTNSGPLGSPKQVAAQAKANAVLNATFANLTKSMTATTANIAQWVNIRDKNGGDPEVYNPLIQAGQAQMQSYQAQQDRIMKQLQGQAGGSGGNNQQPSTQSSKQAAPVAQSPADDDAGTKDSSKNDPKSIY